MAGYQKLASMIGSHSDLAVFRKFGTLAAKNLLYMQAELVHLEAELGDIVQQDLQDSERQDFGTCWESLKSVCNNDGADFQWKKVLEVRQKLKDYHATLLQTAQIYGLAKPLEADLTFLRDWLERPEGGYYFLKGIEADPWDLKYSPDLVVLSENAGRRDRFAQFMSERIIPFYHRRIGHKIQKPILDKEWSAVWEYKYEVFVILGNVVCMVLSSVVPIGSILCLYFVKSMVARLAVICGMSFLFSFIMTVIVQGRRVDVFAATTAFAAVQVVFVGGTNIISATE